MIERTQPAVEMPVFTRREFLAKASLAIGATAVSALGFTQKEAISGSARSALFNLLRIGDDYSNDPFHEAVGAKKISRGRLDELLADEIETPPIYMSRTPAEQQNDPTMFAEHTFLFEEDGPVHATFEGLPGDGTSLVVLKASIDDGGKEFLVPLIRTPGDPQPITVQLGAQDNSEHRLDIAIAHATTAVSQEDIKLSLSQGSTDTIQSFIDLHQPDIFLRSYGNIANNFPYGSYVFVNETKDTLSLVYWTTCLDGDLVLGRGTKLRRIVETKNRPNDYDWVMEKEISKKDGQLLRATYAAPYHNRQEYEFDQDDPTHTPIRIASANNNVELVSRDAVLSRARFRPRPQVFVHDERWDVLYQTSEAAAQYNMCENFKEGTLVLPRDQWILDEFNADITKCEN